jgi:anaerobic ribonucleoside-triphosphate reductase
MYQVVKRDGKVADFNLSKISVAITKAFEATHKEYNPDIRLCGRGEELHPVPQAA